jgi:hypothetical protein
MLSRERSPQAFDARPRPDNSLFRRSIPCFGNRNSLIRQEQESARKPLELLRDLAPTIARMVENLQNSLLNSLFAGNCPCLTKEVHSTPSTDRTPDRAIRFEAGSAELSHRRDLE